MSVKPSFYTITTIAAEKLNDRCDDWFHMNDTNAELENRNTKFTFASLPYSLGISALFAYLDGAFGFNV